MTENSQPETSDWYGCYKRSWAGLLAPEAFAHPAKVAFGLSERIYRHLAEEGHLQPGSTVVDPFGGIAGCGLHAALRGCHFIGLELEPRFVELGNQNIAKWKETYHRLPGYGSVTLQQGDSRYLADGLASANAAVSSPPYADISQSGGTRGLQKHGTGLTHGGACFGEYGSTPGNLGRLAANEDGFSAAVSSPPYAEARVGQESGQEQCGRGDQYGLTPGQLGSMKAADFDAAVSSPPYVDSITDRSEATIQRDQQHRANIGRDPQSPGSLPVNEYGRTPGQLGSAAADDFWTAARQILDQVYSILRPGAPAVWIVKAFVKNKQLVDFPGQWQQLCQAAGFQTVHLHRAWLIEDRGTQYALDGTAVTKRIERKSFFRRMNESKGSPAIDYEMVICTRKPDRRQE